MSCAGAGGVADLVPAVEDDRAAAAVAQQVIERGVVDATEGARRNTDQAVHAVPHRTAVGDGDGYPVGGGVVEQLARHWLDPVGQRLGGPANDLGHHVLTGEPALPPLDVAVGDLGTQSLLPGAEELFAQARVELGIATEHGFQRRHRLAVRCRSEVTRWASGYAAARATAAAAACAWPRGDGPAHGLPLDVPLCVPERLAVAHENQVLHRSPAAPA